MANEIAVKILEQLGGNRFMAMTGCKQIVALPDGVQFGIGRGAADGINKIKVTLADDLYSVEFWKIRGVDMKLVRSFDLVGAERLAGVFTEGTGFDTRL